MSSLNWAKMQGVENMQARIRAAGKTFIESAASALFQETEIEATECKRRCPVWNPARPVPEGHAPGTLRSTIQALGPFTEGKTFYTLIVCGGPLAPYAIYVHEDLDAYHATGEAKFIEGPILESRPYMAQRVQKRMRLNSLKG